MSKSLPLSQNNLTLLQSEIAKLYPEYKSQILNRFIWEQGELLSRNKNSIDNSLSCSNVLTEEGTYHCPKKTVTSGNDKEYELYQEPQTVIYSSMAGNTNLPYTASFLGSSKTIENFEVDSVEWPSSYCSVDESQDIVDEGNRNSPMTRQTPTPESRIGISKDFKNRRKRKNKYGVCYFHNNEARTSHKADGQKSPILMGQQFLLRNQENVRTSTKCVFLNGMQVKSVSKRADADSKSCKKLHSKELEFQTLSSKQNSSTLVSDLAITPREQIIASTYNKVASPYSSLLQNHADMNGLSALESYSTNVHQRAALTEIECSRGCISYEPHEHPNELGCSQYSQLLREVEYLSNKLHTLEESTENPDDILRFVEEYINSSSDRSRWTTLDTNIFL
ncbi:hypothetical protein V1511DRAFT_529104 [Dipodascopsis uninucleata]